MLQIVLLLAVLVIGVWSLNEIVPRYRALKERERKEKEQAQRTYQPVPESKRDACDRGCAGCVTVRHTLGGIK